MPRSTRACPSLEEDQPQFKLGQYLRIKEQDKPAWHHAWVTHVYPCSIRIEYDDNEGTRDQIVAPEYETRVRLPSFAFLTSELPLSWRLALWVMPNSDLQGGAHEQAQANAN